MIKIKSILFVLLLFASMQMAGENNFQPLTINGEEIDKSVDGITYDGDNVFLHWSDGSTSNNESKAILNVSNSSNINDVKIFSISGFQGNNLKIDGLNQNQELVIYDIMGKMQLQTKAVASNTDWNINQLNTGIYLLKANDAVIKFVKK